MKRLFSRRGFIAIMIFSALAVVTPTTTRGQGAGLVSAVLNSMERNRQDLKSLRAGISMEKYNSQLHDSDRSDGVILYEPAGARDGLHVTPGTRNSLPAGSGRP